MWGAAGFQESVTVRALVSAVVVETSGRADRREASQRQSRATNPRGEFPNQPGSSSAPSKCRVGEPGLQEKVVSGNGGNTHRRDESRAGNLVQGGGVPLSWPIDIHNEGTDRTPPVSDTEGKRERHTPLHRSNVNAPLLFRSSRGCALTAVRDLGDQGRRGTSGRLRENSETHARDLGHAPCRCPSPVVMSDVYSSSCL
jgi:hypothetical protein